MTEGKRTTSLRSQLPLSERWRNVKVNALLVFVTMIWGSTFLIVQQTTGSQYTTSSKAGFITGLYVPLVAILGVPMLRQKPTLGSMLGVIFSVAGLALISVNSSFQFTFGLGEFLVMGCAVACALHVIFISKFAPRVDAMNLALVQIALTAVLSLIAMPLAREPFVLPPLPVWASALFMGLAAT